MGKMNRIPRPDNMKIFIVFKGMFSSGNITKDYFLAFLGQKQRMKKIPDLFGQNDGLTAPEKNPIW